MNAPETHVLFDLSELGVVLVYGDDAADFLQGQLSNDLSHLSDATPHQLSAYCNPKGRMLALFHLIKLGSKYALIAPREVLAKVLPRLKMFVMRASVTIEQDDHIRLLGLHASDGVDAKQLKLPGATDAILAAHSNDPNRYFLLGSDAKPGKLKPASDWNNIDIIQHLPQVYAALHESLIPQSLNLDIVGGVNFKKGCYPGQEIIARVKYRGKPKTRMIGVRAPQTADIELAAPIFIDDRERSAGLVCNIAQGVGSMLMSITLPVTHIREGKLYLDQAKTIELTRLDSPYEITA